MSSSLVGQFEGVSKRYRDPWRPGKSVTAVDDVSFGLEAGEVFGLLGPNRAGKTTLVKLLLSLCRPSSGQVWRWGRPARDRRNLARIGYLHERQAFPGYLPAAQLLAYYGALTGLAEERLQPRVRPLLEWVGLADRAREPISRFSKGMVQRLALAQAVINEPDLLALDEPMEGLDLPGRRLVHEAIEEQRRLGRSVLLVTHLAEEAEALCDRVAVLVGGRLAYTGPTGGLLEIPGGGRRSLAEALNELYAK